MFFNKDWLFIFFKVQWSKDGKDVESSERFKFSQDGNTFTFEIPAALATDSGEYTVTAKNSTGSSQWTFTLSVAVSQSPVADVDVVKLIADMQVRMAVWHKTNSTVIMG